MTLKADWADVFFILQEGHCRVSRDKMIWKFYKLNELKKKEKISMSVWKQCKNKQWYRMAALYDSKTGNVDVRIQLKKEKAGARPNGMKVGIYIFSRKGTQLGSAVKDLKFAVNERNPMSKIEDVIPFAKLRELNDAFLIVAQLQSPSKKAPGTVSKAKRKKAVEAITGRKRRRVEEDHKAETAGGDEESDSDYSSDDDAPIYTKVTKDEILMMRKLLTKAEEAASKEENMTAKQLFKRYDKDGNGVLDQKEFEDYVKATMGDDVEDQAIVKAFRTIDKDFSQGIDYEEFRSHLDIISQLIVDED